jgi:hypothetical protein
MTKIEYGDALEKVREELTSLRELRIQTEIRIAQLERTEAGLATLCGEEEAPLEKGLTDACRAVLQAGEKRADFTPTEVRDALLKIAYPLDKYSNALAAIHTTLKRLAERGEATIVARGPSVIAYRWTLNDPSALAVLRTAKGKATVLRFVDELARKKA